MEIKKASDKKLYFYLNLKKQALQNELPTSLEEIELPWMSIRQLILLFTFIFFPGALYATVGGPQFLQILGYKENSLYFIYEYHDEGVNSPELWRYDLSGDSLYITSDWINYPDESIDKALKRHNLDMLRVPDTIAYAPDDHIRFIFGEPVEQYMESMDVYYDLYPVNVQWDDELYNIFQCYDRNEQPEVRTALTFKDLKISLAIIRYKGICFETGYLKDTLLIKPSQENASVKPLPQATDANDDDQLPLIIVLVTLSALLMLIILFKARK